MADEGGGEGQRSGRIASCSTLAFAMPAAEWALGARLLSPPIDSRSEWVHNHASGEFSGPCVMIPFLRNPEGALARAFRPTAHLPNALTFARV